MRERWSPDWIEDVSQATYDALRDVYVPEMPPIEEALAYLIAYLLEIGPTVPAGMSSGWIEMDKIDAWCRRTGIDLAPWESRFLVRLSKDYLGESQKATKQGAPAPWQIPGSKPEPSALQLSMRAAAEE